MLSMVSRILGNIFINLVGIYIAGRILDKPIRLLKKFNNVILILLMGIITTYIYIFTDGIIRVGLNIFLIAYGIKIIFNNDTFKCFKISIILIIISIISECICVIFIIFALNGNLLRLNELVFGKFIANIVIALGMIVIYNVLKVKIKQLVQKDLLNSVVSITLVIICLLIVITYMFQNIKMNVYGPSLIINIFSPLIMVWLLYLILTEKIKNKIANEERIILNKNIIIYEKTVEKLRISQHENKNELSIIKNMVTPGNQKLKNYVDELLSEKKIDEDVAVMLKLKTIDSALIKSLLYEKTNQIYSKKIKLMLNIANQRDSLINHLTINIEKDLCKIIGSLIDNATDCVVKNSNYIMGIILFSDKNSVRLDVFNNYDSIKFLENENNYKKGMFLNLKKRGNGLNLVNRIVQKYYGLSFNTEVDNNYISQKIIYVRDTKHI